MHVDKGERTFIKDDDSFADVMRTRIFGKESSGVVVQMVLKIKELYFRNSWFYLKMSEELK